MSKKKNEKNFLDLIPLISPSLDWEVNEKDEVTIHIPLKGFFHWIAQKGFKKPSVRHLSLDTYGNFIWKRIDGKRSVYDIALEVEEHFGEDAKPLYDRLVQYMKILINNGFILMRDL
ncbi:MAG TPA: PqqD family protein [Lachnospiraceae bacterium]